MTKYLLTFLLAYSICSAQNIITENKKLNNSNWTLETSLTFPAVKIYMVQFGYRLGEKSELVFGPCYQNWSNWEGTAELKGTAHAYTLIAGYRQYIWKKLNAEVQLFPAYNEFDSGIDGKTYKGFELWSEFRIGWKIDFKIADYDLFVIPQPGIGYGIYLENIWPGLDKDNWRKKTLIFVPQIILGIKL